MDSYFIIKSLHIFSSTILLGTGLGIAFFMLRSSVTENVHEKLYAIRNAVLADFLFTIPAVTVAPITGAWLIWKNGYDWREWWLTITYIIYIIAGLCWLPAFGIQLKLKKILTQCTQDNTPPPGHYYKLFNMCFMLGWPAFGGLIIIFFLMVSKPH